MQISVTARTNSTKEISELERQHNAAIARTLTAAVARLAVATPVRTGVARAGWRYSNGSIRNDVPYVSELNAGTSQQAPAHFVEMALLADPHILPDGTIVHRAR